jgi:acyl-coenzyme A thioesterase PaaI-like protein
VAKQGFLSRIRLGANALRLAMNVWPPFIGAGIHVERISEDYRQVRVRLRLGLLNRNYFGTHFGGSLYAMTDPFYALMLLHNLPRGYVVWDKTSQIHYKAPGRGRVYANFALDDARIAEVLAATADGKRYEPTWPVDVVDAAGTVIATVDKTLYVSYRPPGAPRPATAPSAKLGA